MYATFTEALEGAASIRAYDAQRRFCQLNEHQVALSQQAAFAGKVMDVCVVRYCLDVKTGFAPRTTSLTQVVLTRKNHCGQTAMIRCIDQDCTYRNATRCISLMHFHNSKAQELTMRQVAHENYASSCT